MSSKKGGGGDTSSSQYTPNPAATQAFTDVMGRANNVANQPFTPYSGGVMAGFNPTQQAAFSNINNASGLAQPYIGQAGNLVQNATSGIDPTATLGQFQNPYTSQVTNATQNQFNEQNAQRGVGMTGNQIAQGAYGGDRAAVGQGVLAGQEQMAQAPVIAGLQQHGYEQALNTGLQTQEANAGLGMQGAFALGNLGNEAQSSALQGSQAQLQAGNQQQQQAQQQLNAPYQAYQAGQAFPYQNTNFLSGTVGGLAPALGGTTTQTQPGGSPISQLAGLGLAGAALYRAFERGGAIERADGGIVPPDLSVSSIPANGMPQRAFGQPGAGQMMQRQAGLGDSGIGGILKEAGAIRGFMQPGMGSSDPYDVGGMEKGFGGGSDWFSTGGIVHPEYRDEAPRLASGGWDDSQDDFPPAFYPNGSPIANFFSQTKNLSPEERQKAIDMASPPANGLGVPTIVPRKPSSIPSQYQGATETGGQPLFFPQEEIAPRLGLPPSQNAPTDAYDPGQRQLTDTAPAAMEPTATTDPRGEPGGGNAYTPGEAPVYGSPAPSGPSNLGTAPTGSDDANIPPPPPPPPGDPNAPQVGLGTQMPNTAPGQEGSWMDKLVYGPNGALLSAGLGMMAGRSRNPLVNIAQGGQMALSMAQQQAAMRATNALKSQQAAWTHEYQLGRINNQGDRNQTYALLSQAKSGELGAQAQMLMARAAAGMANHATPGDIQAKAIEEAMKGDSTRLDLLRTLSGKQDTADYHNSLLDQNDAKILNLEANRTKVNALRKQNLSDAAIATQLRTATSGANAITNSNTALGKPTNYDAALTSAQGSQSRVRQQLQGNPSPASSAPTKYDPSVPPVSGQRYLMPDNTIRTAP